MNNYELLIQTKAKLIKLRELSKELDKNIKGSRAILKEHIKQIEEEFAQLEEVCAKEFPEKTLTHSIGMHCRASSEMEDVKEKIKKEFGDRVHIEHFEGDDNLFMDVNESDLEGAMKFANNLLRDHDEIFQIYAPEKAETLSSWPSFMGEYDPISYCKQAGIDVSVELPEEVRNKLVSKMEEALMAYTNRCKEFLSLVEGAMTTKTSN